MLKKFLINNFKSLVDFEVEFSRFNCLIGLNGAGKSTLLQAIDFASSLMTGEVESWLSKRGWSSKDVN
ncbi:MAG: AAA family ATPase, partial [Chlorobium sp.]